VNDLDLEYLEIPGTRGPIREQLLINISHLESANLQIQREIEENCSVLLDSLSY
jgi:hypothetical protein